MNKLEQLDNSLIKICKLLKCSSSATWAEAFEHLQRDLRESPSTGVTKILATYGGMSSFNDVVLYSNGILMRSENKELDQLRSEIFNICQELRSIY